MAKNLLRDVIKIKIVKKEEPIKQERYDDIKIKQNQDRPNFDEGDKRNNNHSSAIWIVALASLVFLFFAISFLFAGAKITINPKIKEVTLNENMSAVKDSNDNTELAFDLVALPGEETKEIKGVEEKDYLEKAKGTVVIYNAFSAASQRLTIETRLEGSNGKIYKTDSEVVVPGMKDTVPGSIEMGIHATDPGEEYNSGPLDFKIFGFKGTPKYEKFYARSKGDITGGLKGKSRQISEADKVAAKGELTATLKEKLFKKAEDQIPEGFIFYKDAVFLNIDGESADSTPKDGDTVTYHLKGTLYGFLFNEKKLTNKIVTTVIDKYDGSEVYIPNIKNLVFSLSDKENVNFKEVNQINFSLSGPAKIVWKFDDANLLSQVLGKSKSDFNQILTEYPNVDSADVVIKPAWKMSFPDKAKDIKVIVNYPQ